MKATAPARRALVFPRLRRSTPSRPCSSRAAAPTQSQPEVLESSDVVRAMDVPLAARFVSIVLHREGNQTVPFGVAAEALQGGLSAVFRDQLFVVEVGDAGHAVERSDELLRPQAAAEEGMG